MNVRWLVLLAAMAALVAVACAPTPTVTPTGQPTGISVSGQGSVTVKPDIAQVTLGVELTSPPGGAAWQQVADTMAAVVAKLKELGIEEKDIKTSRVSASISGLPGQPAKFVVTNLVTVKVRDLNRMGAVLDGAMAAGANLIGDLSFTVDDPEALLRQAREAAMADARAKAEQLAKLAGVKVGKPLRIDEGGGPTPYPLGMGMGAGTPISPGETEVSVSLSVTYAIE